MANKMKIRLIAFDLDGTLLTAKKEISEKTRAVLEQAAAEGIRLVPATGRAFGAVPEAVRTLSGVEYVITSNGAAVERAADGFRLQECLLGASAAERILDVLKGQEIVWEAYIRGVPYADARYVRDPMKYGSTEYGTVYVKNTRHPVDEMEAFIRENRDRLDGIACVCADSGRLARLRRAVETNVPEVYVTSSVPRLLEMAGRNAGKAGALRWILEQEGIAPEEAMAFGDGDNDAEMLAAVAYGFAMENATEACRAAAFAVTGSNEDDGVGNAVLQYLKG